MTAGHSVAEAPARLPRWTVVTLIGFASFVIVLGRLHFRTSAVWTDTLWAEDGLFALCAARDGLWACLWEPYAGYLPWWPKLVSGLIGTTPLNAWPALTLVAAAASAALVSAIAAWLLLADQYPIFLAALAGLAPVLLPAFGEEAVGSVANSIYLITYAGALAIAFPNSSRAYLLVSFPLLLVVALSTPLGLVLLAAAFFQLNRQRFEKRATGYLMLLTLAGGSALQFITIANARGDRDLVSVAEVPTSWGSGVWIQAVKILPFPGSPVSQLLTNEGGATAVVFGLALVLALAMAGIWLMGGSDADHQTVGLMWFMAVLLSAIPHLANQSLARYFIAPVSLFLVGAFLLLDRRLRRTRWELASIGIAALVAISWLPAFISPSERADGNPPWPTVLDLARQACAERPNESVGFVFTPWWPASPDGSQEATARAAPCLVLSQG